MRARCGPRRRLPRYLAFVTALTIAIVGTPATAAAAPNSIASLYPPLASVHLETNTPEPRLSGGNWILSEGTHFHYGDFVQVGKSQLIFQSDGNLVLYDEVGHARWASGTDHRGQEGIFQKDGNLVVYVSRGRPFASRTCCFTGLELGVFADGNLMIYQISTGQIRWATWTAH